VNVTVGEALESRRSQELGEKIVYFYIVDRDGQLEGLVPTRRLLMSDPGVKVSAIMSSRVVSPPAWATVREASDLFLRRSCAGTTIVAGPIVLALADVETLIFYLNLAGVLLQT